MNNPKGVEVVWEFHRPDEGAVARLVHQLGIGDSLARVLVNRGLTDPGKTRSFLKPSLKDLESPDNLPDLEAAVERLSLALKRDELIAVYGDYDVDGITSTALLANFLRGLGANFVTYTPDRIVEGYGLHVSAVEELHKKGVRLLVAVDLGVGDVDAIGKAKEFGMDVVVVDHHQVPDELPDAVALIDPYRSGGGEFFRGLSAAGLTFYLIVAFRARLRDGGSFNGKKEPNLRADLDLVALGTIADLAPLAGPNRIFAHFGLMELGAERRPGIAALKRVAGMGRRDVTAGQVAFQLAPRINAAGRVGKAENAVRLLTTPSMDEAMKIAQELNTLNTRRQEIEARILKEAFDTIEREGLQQGSAVVIGGRNWHPGVIGIVASKISETYGLPSVVVALAGDNSKGSARSVRGLHLYRAMKDCSKWLVGFGGHEMAAGIVLKEDDMEAFRQRFEEVVAAAEPPLRQSVIKLDAELDLEDLDGVLTEALGSMHPHGMANPEPLFYAGGIRPSDPHKVGINHLKFRITAAEGPIEAISFGKGDLLDLVKEQPVDIAYTPRMTTWEGWRRLEIKVRDIRPAR